MARTTTTRRTGRSAARRGTTARTTRQARTSRTASKRPTLAGRAASSSTRGKATAKRGGAGTATRQAAAASPAKMGSRKCDMCPTSFQPYSKVQRYCSDACRQRAFYRRFKRLYRRRPAEVYGAR